MTAPISIGVDNGGTWIRLKGLDKRGRVVWSLKKPSPTVEHLPTFLRKHLKRFGGMSTCLAVGSRGVWKQSKRRHLKKALTGLARQIVVMSDVEAAWVAAFGAMSNRKKLIAHRSLLGTGIVVISGTGSIAYGRNADGAFARAGGLGPDKGDEGSGFWIGRRWLEMTGRLAPNNVRAVAALAPGIITRARHGHPTAQKIIREAQEELAALAQGVAGQLSLKTPRVSGAGSILANPWFRKGFKKALSPLKATLRSAKTDVPTALAKSIMGHGR